MAKWVGTIKRKFGNGHYQVTITESDDGFWYESKTMLIFKGHATSLSAAKRKAREEIGEFGEGRMTWRYFHF